MNIKCCIVGLPNVGKSALFNVLTNQQINSQNYPFCTIKSNLGSVNVPDDRLNKLSNIFNIKNIIKSNIEIIDVAGLVKNASQGMGLGNKFLSDIRNTNLIIHVLRCFDNTEISHIYNTVDPLRDKEIVELELQLKDLETIDKRMLKINKYCDTKNLLNEKIFLDKCKNLLLKGVNLNYMQDISNSNLHILNNISFLTYKKSIFVGNISNNNYIYIDKLKNKYSLDNDSIISIDINSYKNDCDNINLLIKKCFNMLNMINFFTIDNKEIHSWCIKKGSTILDAAGIIHSDIKKNFICSEVYSYYDICEYKSLNALKLNYKKNIKGKDYLIKDGDIINIKHR
ncbi:MAG: redox-regulated ATPase YchF [Bacteroides sp.]|nr:MAG: redox-regulated ATPase YchF [Bacteroides sp.]